MSLSIRLVLSSVWLSERLSNFSKFVIIRSSCTCFWLMCIYLHMHWGLSWILCLFWHFGAGHHCLWHLISALLMSHKVILDVVISNILSLPCWNWTLLSLPFFSWKLLSQKLCLSLACVKNCCFWHYCLEHIFQPCWHAWFCMLQNCNLSTL